MKVLTVNTYESGGAAKAAFRLADGLKNNGVEVSLLLKRNNSNDINAEVLSPKKLPLLKLISQKIKRLFFKLGFIDKSTSLSKKEKFLDQRAEGLELYTFPDSLFDITESDSYKKADIINFHWVSDFLDYSSFFKKNTKPVVWTMHDMNPFSGGEHYEEIFTGIDKNGFPVKRKLTSAEELMFKSITDIKKESLHDVRNVVTVSPSQWLAQKAKESELLKKIPVYCIPNSVNTDVYKLSDKEEARKELNIPLNKKVVLFVAESLTCYRKGFVFLKRALEFLNRDDVLLCVVGKNKADLDFANCIELGLIKDEVKMSMIYAAADVFIIPSLMDNLPNTVVESLCCGTPVIGFPVGGIPEMIINGKNGFITDEVSSDALLKSIKEFLSDTNRFDSEYIHKEAIKKYNLDVQAKAYIDLFKTVLVNEN